MAISVRDASADVAMTPRRRNEAGETRGSEPISVTQPGPAVAVDPARRFAVIGAGAAGLACAKHLLQSGFSNVTIFEIGTKIGGLWCYGNDNGRSSAYRTLHINTAKNITNFSDLPFDSDVKLFPSHDDMYRYLTKFVEHFDLAKHIRFKSRVVSVRLKDGSDRDNPVWVLDVEGGGPEEFDRVIVATGHLSDPMDVPEFKEKFGGEYLHSHHYRVPEPFTGKKVCIVGVGNSAMDISSDICVIAAKTVLVARSGVKIFPKLIAGIPFTDLTMKLYREWIPARLRGWALSFLTYLAHGDMRKLGFRPVTAKTHAVSSAVAVSHIAYHRIVVKHEIEKIEDRRIFFSDGTSDEFDVLIGATGYRITLPFFDPEMVPIVNNGISLFRRIVPPDWRGLYFMGFINPTAALNLSYEYQARWICGIETGLIELPSRDAMRDEIRRKNEITRKNYKNTPRHTIEEDHPRYFRELRHKALRRLFPKQLPR